MRLERPEMWRHLNRNASWPCARRFVSRLRWLCITALLLGAACSPVMKSGDNNQPLRAQIESTTGDTRAFEDLVRNYLQEEASKGRNLADSLQMNGFEEVGCPPGADKCFSFKTKGLIQTAIFVSLNRSNDKSQWSVRLIGVNFTGP